MGFGFLVLDTFLIALVVIENTWIDVVCLFFF